MNIFKLIGNYLDRKNAEQKVQELIRKQELLARMKALPENPFCAKVRKIEIEMLERSIREASCEHLIGLGGSCARCGYISSSGLD